MNKTGLRRILKQSRMLRSLVQSKRGRLIRARAQNVTSRLKYLFIGDEALNRRLYRTKKGTALNLKDPRTFSEKVIFLKLYYRNPLVTLCADKYHVREYVRACGFGDILKQVYAVFRDVNELDFSSMPDRFFLKCNHLAGEGVVIDKKIDVDYGFLKKSFNIFLKRNHYYLFREWCYRHIRPLIICEECLLDDKGNLPIDYKFYCFGGEPKYVMVSYGEYQHRVRNHKFDMNFNSIDLQFKAESTINAREIEKPATFDRMVEIAGTLSKPFPHVRVDLYNLNGRIYFGELTFYSNAGFIDVHSHEMDLLIGSWIKLEDYSRDIIKR